MFLAFSITSNKCFGIDHNDNLLKIVLFSNCLLTKLKLAFSLMPYNFFFLLKNRPRPCITDKFPQTSYSNIAKHWTSGEITQTKVMNFHYLSLAKIYFICLLSLIRDIMLLWQLHSLSKMYLLQLHLFQHSTVQAQKS